MKELQFTNNKNLTRWLFICCAAIFVMVLLGGLTRLTDSGLSIVKWEPLSGAIPPMSETAWQGYFEAYKKIPEYQQQNKGMSLEEFKGIFWLEYFHRLMGRAIGILFLLPLVYFAVKKQINKQTAVKFGGIFLLGVVQGAIGWYMVSSGFNDRTDVSQYRLALHLGAAFLIFLLLYWAYMDSRYGVGGKLQKFPVIVTGSIFFMIILGAFVAGTDAGFVYNTFPLMDGKFIPDYLYMQDPKWINHFENLTMIQFQHRIFAYIVSALVIALAIKTRYWPIVAVLLIQIGLGIATLYSFGSYADYEVTTHAYTKVLYTPVILGAAHQLNALVLFAMSLKIMHATRGD